jgi:phosphate transport system substrate-binding protein
MRFRILAICAAAWTCAATVVASGPASAQQARTLRERMVIVGSSTMKAYADVVFDQLQKTRGIKPPEEAPAGGLRGPRRFCEGLGAQYPDILASARRMPRALYETCIARGVLDIIEVKLGLGAVVLATKRGENKFGLSPLQIYRALAAEIPDKDHGEIKPNTYVKWSEVSPELPDEPIKVIGPEKSSGMRTFFDDAILQTGCRKEPTIRMIYDAGLRVQKCTTLRTDGVFAEVPEGQSTVAALMSSEPGTIAILGYGELVASGGNAAALALDGVIPSYQTIAGEDYTFARTLYFYVKRAHMPSEGGVGVVNGLQEFLNEVTSEQMIGPGGALNEHGLVSLPAALRVEQRRSVERLRRFAP